MSKKNLFRRIADTAVITSSLVFGSLGLADARDIICDKQVQVCVPEVVTCDQVRQGTREVPVTCYRTETRCIEEEVCEPTCDPCNPFVKRRIGKEVQVQVPYITTQVVPFEVHEKVQRMQSHMETRTVRTTVHIDDCATPNGCYTQPCQQPSQACWPNASSCGTNQFASKKQSDWYPGKNVLNYAVRPAVGITLDVTGKVTKGVGELLVIAGSKEQHRGDVMREKGREARVSHAYAPGYGSGYAPVQGPCCDRGFSSPYAAPSQYVAPQNNFAPNAPSQDYQAPQNPTPAPSQDYQAPQGAPDTIPAPPAPGQ